MSCTPECASSTRRCRRRVIRSEHGLKVLEGGKSYQLLPKVVTFLRSESPRLQEVLCIIRERRKTMPRHHTPPQKPRTPPELELKSNFSVAPASVVCTFHPHSSFVPHFHHTFAGSKGYLSPAEIVYLHLHFMFQEGRNITLHQSKWKYLFREGKLWFIHSVNNQY